MTLDIPLSPLDTALTEPRPAAAWKRRTRWQRAYQVLAPLLRRPGFSLALLIVLFALLCALAPHWLSSFDPYATAPADKLSPPSLAHWFGTRPEFWMNLQAMHDVRLAQLAAGREIQSLPTGPGRRPPGSAV